MLSQVRSAVGASARLGADVPIEQVAGLDLAPSSVTVVMCVLRDLLGDAAAEGAIPPALLPQSSTARCDAPDATEGAL